MSPLKRYPSLTAVVGVVPNVLSRYLRDEFMPVKHHAALVEYGVPEEVLPPPGVCKRGRPNRIPVTQASV